MKRLVVLLASAAASASSVAVGCDALRSEVERKIAAAGVARFSVVVVDADAAASGAVVGRCEQGSKKLLYAKAASAAADPLTVSTLKPPLRAPPVTECKDGPIRNVGNCEK